MIDERRTWLGDRGISARIEAEAGARAILDEMAGSMDVETFTRLGRLINSHWGDGKARFDRFSPMFHGATIKRLYGDGEAVNEWTERIWRAETAEIALDAFDRLMKDPHLLIGAGQSYPSALMYLRDPDEFSIWTDNLDKGLAALIDDYPGASRADGAQGYLEFCSTVKLLIADTGLAPQEVDGILTDSMRELRESTVRPEDLANELGIDGKAVRAYLREQYPRAESEQGRAWKLSGEQIEAVYEFFGTIVEDDSNEGGLADPWDDFIAWAKVYFEWDGFDNEERDYKLELAERLRLLRDNVQNNEHDWLTDLKRAFGPPNNLTYYITHSKYLDWVAGDADAARDGLLALWDTDREVEDRIDGFMSQLPDAEVAGAGSRLQIAAYLLMAEPADYPIYRPKPFKAAAALVDYPEFPKGPEAALYSHALGFLDELVSQAEARGLHLRDRLDAQSLIWAVTQNDFAAAGVSDDALEQLRRYRGDNPAVWWVNQGTSLKREMEAGVVSAALVNKAGNDLQHWKNIESLRPGDVILHYADGAVRAISETTSKPTRGALRWADGIEGRYAKVGYFPLAEPIPIADVPIDRRVPGDGPFTQQGSIKQVYLEALSVPLSEWLKAEYRDRWPEGSPWAARTRPTWLFQANPKVWNLSEKIKGMEIGDSDTWTVSRFKSEIAVGDRVLLWQGGEHAGVYGIGQISGELFERSTDDEQFTSAETELAIPYTLTRKLVTPILRSTLLEHPLLKGLNVITAPQGSNFRVTDEQWAELQNVLNSETSPRIESQAAVTLNDISLFMANEGLLISERLLRRFHVSLQTRGFVVLSGVSGTGKTWLTEAYAKAMGAEYRLVPVAPNWTTNEDLLGYLNPLDDVYHHTTFSRFLQKAADAYEDATADQREPQKFILALDEMNLARVEYYFAKFLSAMEVRSRRGTADIELAADNIVQLTPNLLFVGTVNIDETTHGFADKVFDRAQLIEMEAPRDALAEHIGRAEFRESLLDVYDAVAGAKPFAYRVVDDVRDYVAHSEAEDVEWRDAIDEQILQKVLPKLSGADPAIRFALENIVNVCEQHGFTLTADKAHRMLNDFNRDGFTSYF